MIILATIIAALIAIAVLYKVIQDAHHQNKMMQNLTPVEVDLDYVDKLIDKLKNTVFEMCMLYYIKNGIAISVAPSYDCAIHEECWED